MTSLMRIAEIDGATALTFNCGALPVDDAVVAAGHEPNGYFWESVAQYLASDVMPQLELDSEASLFCAYGHRVLLERLQQALAPYLTDARRIGELIRQAEAEGFEFDD